MSGLSRRRFLLAGAAAAVAGACRTGDGDDDAVAGDRAATTAAGTPTTTAVAGPPELAPDLAAVAVPSDPFTLGVASGDPDATSVVLWTRLAPDPFVAGAGLPEDLRDIAVELAPDDTFTTGVRAGRFPVDVERGHSVHAVVDGLEPATTYRYRFRIGTWTSPVGTTRTTPAPGDTTTALRLAVAACQRYEDGAFAAHADIAAAGVDLVAFVGDYVYETGSGPSAVRVQPGPRAADDATDLTGYRDRYVAARLDPHLAAAHAACPWVLVWDDHEVHNNPSGHQVDPARRAAAYRAWWEHLPVRLPPPPLDATEPYPITRAVRWGGLAEVLAVDTRQFRAGPACGGGLVDVDECGALADSGRTMFGDDQRERLHALLEGDAPAWTLLANSVVFSEVAILGMVNADAWDGYPVARANLLADLAGAGRTDTVVLTGDIHVALVADVTDGDGRTVATELVTPSISSRVADTYTEAIPFLPLVARNVVHAADHRGWLRCDVTAAAVTARYRRVVDPADPASPVVDGEAFTVERGRPGARPA